MISQLFHRHKSKGQSTAEYAIVIALVMGAVAAMQVYVKRSLQGGVKFAVDKLKKDDTATAQYEPYYKSSRYATEDAVDGQYTETEQTWAGGKVTRTLASESVPQTTKRHGWSQTRGTANVD